MRATYFFVILSSLFISCTSSKGEESINFIPVTSNNPKAIEFYRNARNNFFNQEYVEAKNNYLSALRLDPNFIMANLQINESNALVKRGLVEKARDQIDNGNDYEKLYLSYLDSDSRIEKRKIANEIIKKYPNYIEGFELLIETYYNNQERGQGTEILEELINKFPNSERIFFQYIRFKYSGSLNSIILKKDLKFYNDFLKISNIVSDKFSNSLRILNLLGQVFRQSINFEDNTRFDKAISYYQKAQDIVNRTGSSQKIGLNRNIGRTYLSNGKLEEALPYYLEAIKLSDNSSSKINSYFDLFLAYLYEGNYFETIREIESFENNLSTYGFTEEEALRAKVGIYNFKTIIYSHANQKERALNSFETYVKYSNDLISYYGFTGSDIEIDNSINRLLGSNITRFKTSSPKEQLWHRIWISILTGDYDLSLKLLENHKLKFNDDIPYFRGQLNIMKGNINEGYDILKNNSFGYFQYFKAQALIGMGKTENAKQVLDSVRQLTAGSIFTSLVSKKAKLLYENL